MFAISCLVTALDVFGVLLFSQLEICTGQSITTRGESESVSTYVISPIATSESGNLPLLPGNCEGGIFVLFVCIEN
jgi:hypothetical protein